MLPRDCLTIPNARREDREDCRDVCLQYSRKLREAVLRPITPHRRDEVSGQVALRDESLLVTRALIFIFSGGCRCCNI